MPKIQQEDKAMSQESSKLSQHLKKAMITMQLCGCSSEEASKITGLSKRHLLRLHRDGDTRIISYQVGREIIFDKPNLIRMKESFSPRNPTIH